MTEFIYLHGFASGPSSKKASAFKNKFQEVGVSLNIPDLEGGNFENMTLTSQINIIFNLLDQLQCKKVCLIGSSMGGYLATLVAQVKVEIQATYLMAPGFNFLERWMQSLKLDYDDKDANNWSPVALSRKVPARIVHGIHDAVVPIDESKKFVSGRPWCSLKELDTDHGLLSHLGWVVDDCIAFFKKLGILSTE